MKIGRPPPRKTYSRLASGRRVPPEYEIVSSDLHYNYPHRFELPETLPVVDWYYRNREGSPMRANDWEAFSDPRRTTYRVAAQIEGQFFSGHARLIPAQRIWVQLPSRQSGSRDPAKRAECHADQLLLDRQVSLAQASHSGHGRVQRRFREVLTDRLSVAVEKVASLRANLEVGDITAAQVG